MSDDLSYLNCQQYIENKAEIVENSKQIGRRLIVLDSLAHTAHKLWNWRSQCFLSNQPAWYWLAYDIQQRGATHVADRNISQIEHNVPKPLDSSQSEPLMPPEKLNQKTSAVKPPVLPNSKDTVSLPLLTH
jgi:hypothetical protein